MTPTRDSLHAVMLAHGFIVEDDHGIRAYQRYDGDAPDTSDICEIVMARCDYENVPMTPDTPCVVTTQDLINGGETPYWHRWPTFAEVVYHLTRASEYETLELRIDNPRE